MLSEWFEWRDQLDKIQAKRRAIQFARDHAACTICIPPTEEVELIARRDQIVRALDREPGTKTAQRLAELQDVDRSFIDQQYKRAKAQP